MSIQFKSVIHFTNLEPIMLQRELSATEQRTVDLEWNALELGFINTAKEPNMWLRRDSMSVIWINVEHGYADVYVGWPICTYVYGVRDWRKLIDLFTKPL
jgi:hypothetical protein